MRWRIVMSVLISAVLLSGCGMMEERVVYVDSPPPPEVGLAAPPPQRVVEPTQQDMKRRFEPSEAGEGGTVQNAVIWAQKYEELSIRNNELREQNNNLYLENQRLNRETDKLTAELEQTRKELSEANAFLQQMHLELNEWKSDVIGFRDEIRQSQKAQLEALSKVLSVLGAEPVILPETDETESDQ